MTEWPVLRPTLASGLLALAAAAFGQGVPRPDGAWQVLLSSDQHNDALPLARQGDAH